MHSNNETKIISVLKTIEDTQIRKGHLDFALNSGLITHAEYENVLGFYRKKQFNRSEVIELLVALFIAMDDLPPEYILLKLDITKEECLCIRERVLPELGD